MNFAKVKRMKALRFEAWNVSHPTLANNPCKGMILDFVNSQ